MYNTP
jgi:hypothetical protein